MADFIVFTSGQNKILDAGITGTCKFALSTKPCSGTGAHTVGEKELSEVGEITGTGYTQKSQTAPAASEGKKVFAENEWKTGEATDWSAATKSVVMLIGGVPVCAWNLQPGGAARDLSGANTTEKFTPTYNLT